MTILIGSLLGYLILILVYFIPLIGSYLFTICILSGFIAYISQCIGYIVYKIKFDTHEKKMSSPFGIYGAVYSAAVFTLAAIGVLWILCIVILLCMNIIHINMFI
jgi:amino acid permease